jgi:hypothetical protein
LTYLEATWSFKDSWVSNVTIGAGLLTGIFGSSDVVKELLGEDAERSVALATVGAAVAAAFIAAGPLVLHALKTGDGDHFTVFGLLAASAVTLAGAVGELWIMFRTGEKLEVDGLEDKIWVPLGLAAALLILYAFRTLRATLERGITEPDDPPDSDTIKAAKMIVRALLQREGVEAEAADVLAARSIDPIAARGRPRPRAAIL